MKKTKEIRCEECGRIIKYRIVEETQQGEIIRTENILNVTKNVTNKCGYCSGKIVDSERRELHA